MNEVWRTSSHSGPDGGNCVECRTTDTRVQIRDTRHRHLGHLSVPAAEWRAFIHALRHEEL